MAGSTSVGRSFCVHGILDMSLRSSLPILANLTGREVWSSGNTEKELTFTPDTRFSVNCRRAERAPIACSRISAAPRIKIPALVVNFWPMSYRGFFAGLVCVCLSFPLSAQISRDAKYDILRSVIAEQAAARIALPFGADGVELSDSGDFNKEKLERDI